MGTIQWQGQCHQLWDKAKNNSGLKISLGQWILVHANIEVWAYKFKVLAVEVYQQADGAKGWGTSMSGWGTSRQGWVHGQWIGGWSKISRGKISAAEGWVAEWWEEKYKGQQLRYGQLRTRASGYILASKYETNDKNEWWQVGSRLWVQGKWWVTSD